MLANYTATKKTKMLRIFTRDNNNNMNVIKDIIVSGKSEASKICRDNNITKNNF